MLATSAELGDQVAFEALLVAMERQQDEIAADVAARLVADVDGYQVWRSSDLSAQFFEHCRQHIRLLLSMARSGRAPKAAELEFVRQVGIRRADELSPLHVLLHGYRLGHRAAWDWIVRLAPPTPEGWRAAIVLTGTLLDHLEVVSTVVATAYLHRAQRLEVETDRLKQHLLEDLLAGRVALRHGAGARAAAMGLDPAADYCVAIAVLRPPRDTEPDGLRLVVEALVRHLDSGARPPFVVARQHEVVAIVGLAADGPTRTRQQLAAAIELLRRTRVLLVAVGLSTPCEGIAELPRAYAEAARALQHVEPAGGVVALGELAPFDYVLGLAHGTARRIVPAWARQLLEEDRREGGVLVDTLLAYLGAELRIGRTAARLSVHPNTVHNRLRKIRQVTGRSTRQFSDLVQLITAVRLLEADRGAGVQTDQSGRQNAVHPEAPRTGILDV